MKYYDSYEGADKNFWECFPAFKSVSPFKTLFQKDRSASKNKSSKALWYCVLRYDVDSEFYSLEGTEQAGALEETLGFNVPKYLGEEFGKICASYIDFTDTIISADVRALESKLIERKSFINTTSYTLDEWVTPDMGKPYLKKGTAPQLDKMITTTKEIHNQVRELRQMMKDQTAAANRGGVRDSLLDGDD